MQSASLLPLPNHHHLQLYCLNAQVIVINFGSSLIPFVHTPQTLCSWWFHACHSLGVCLSGNIKPHLLISKCHELAFL